MDKIKKNKLLYFLGVLIIGVFIVLIVRVTYAFLGANINEARENVVVDSDTTDNLQFSIGDPLVINATPTTLPENGANLVDESVATATLLANSTNDTAEYSYYVYFTISNNTFTYTDGSTPEIILTVTGPDDNPVTNIDGLTYGTFNGVTGFDVTTQNGTFTVASNYAITASSSTDATKHDWTFTLTYLNLNFDQSGNYGNSMTTEISMTKEEKISTLADVCTSGDNLASCIAEFNTLVGDGVEGIYYHDADLANGAGDNSYRFSGANPNNYVCFGPGAESEGTCANDNLYRIIGIFDDDKDGNYQIKLIKSDYITSAMLGTDGRDYDGAYSYSAPNYKGNMDTSTIAAYRWNYDTSVSEYGSNNWTTSEFNTINLNTNYWNYLDTTWQDLIAETTWRLGGMNTFGTAKAVYDGERNNAGYGSNPTTYTDEIGLMYPSDYGYAASPDAWTNNLFIYNNSTIKSNNWLYMELSEWTITPYSSYSNVVFYVDRDGFLYISDAYNGCAARPVFYLESNAQLEGGSGTSSDPYRLAV